MKQHKKAFSRRISILIASFAAFTGFSNAGIIVTRGHIVGGAATGTLVAIDSPFISNASATATFGGPSWTTGGTIFAHQADQGFAAPSAAGSGLRDFDLNGTSWEPNGTPFSQARGYYIYPDGASPGTTWTFNLAASGVDLPDGTIIHGVYARFGGRNNDKARYEFTEGASSGNLVVDQNAIASVGDLALRWFDSDGNPRDSNFQRIFSGPITVTGGNGFQLGVTDSTGNSGHIDAIVLDTSLPKANDVPAISTLLPVDNKTSVVPWTSLEVTFDEPMALTGTGTVTITDLTDGSSTRVINLPNPQVTSPNGDDLLIKPSTRLELGTQYSVKISADALVDLATVPNAFPGILDDTTWNFSTRAVPNQLHNVLIVTCALADQQPGATTTRATDLLFHDPLNVDEAMRASSYGQIGLNLGDSSGLPATVQLSYPETVAHQKANGGSTGLKNRMATSLAAMGYNLSLSNFRFIIYIQPPSMSAGAAGWANLNSNTSVYLSPIYMRLAMHEMGHCLGGNHSNGSDLGCSLGGADVDYNASKKIHYGWLNAFPGSVQILPANTGTALTLVPLSRSPATTPGVRAVRVPNPNGGTSTYLVSYKINDGPYNTLQDSSYAQKVHVTEDTGGSATTHRATLGAGQEYVVGKLRVICNSVAPGALSADVTIAVGNPILLSIADDVSGGPVTVGQPVNFTVTFDEAMNASTVGVDDFENGSTAGITINSVTTSDNLVFTVAVSTTSPGNLNLRIKAGAVIEDLASTPLLTQSPLPDNTTIAVNALAAPTLVSITDNTSGIPLFVGQSVSYTVTFNEAIKLSTLGTDDFENAATAGITVDSITATGNPAVFTVAVTTTSEGNLRLQIKAGAIVEDLDGSFLNADSPLPDDTIISVKSSSAPLLLTIADNVPGGAIIEGETVTYTVTFDEAINATTLGTDDFENGSSAEISVTSVTATANPAVFTVTVTTAFRGDLVLQIKAAAVIQDLAGFPLVTTSALPDDTIIAVNASPPPTLLSITDNVTGGPVTVGTPVNFTVTFDKAINAATLGTDDFENGSSATITVSSVITTANPAVFTVAVTPTTSGSLNLRIKAGAVIEDIYGLPLDTTIALADNTTIAVFAAPAALYWDANSTATGAGAAPSGTWGTSAFWNSDSTGANGGAFQTLTPNADNLFFVANPGTGSGNNTTAITVSGTQVANSLNFQHSGALTLSGGTSITLGNGGVGSGGITRSQFAFASTAQGSLSITTPIILSNAQTWTNNSTSAFSVKGGINNGGNTLTIAGSGNYDLGDNTANIITGAGGITMSGTGKLTLSAGGTNPVHNFSGALTISGGTVGYQNVPSLGTGNINITNGVLAGRANSGITTRALGVGAGQIQITGGVSGFSGEGAGGSASTYSIAGADPLVWGSTHFNPSQFVLQGSFANNNGMGTFTNNINLNGANRTIRSDQNLASVTAGGGTFSGNITNSTGTAGLTKSGGGLHRLSGTNTYNGGTSINQGTLIFSSKTAMPASGLVSVASGATLGVAVNTGTGWNGGSSNGGLAGLTSGLGGQSGSTVSFAGNSGLLVDVSGNVTESGNLSNGAATNLSLTKMGGSTLTLSGSNNSYSGATNILAGQLTLNGSLTGGGAISTSNAATFFQSGTGVISGAASYTQNSSGTSTLLGNNSYNGGTTINTGILNINSATAIGTGALNLNVNGTSIDNNSGGAVTLSNNNVFNFTQNTTFTGTNSLSNGTGSFTINGNRTITVSANRLTLGGNQTAVSTGGIAKAGNGTLALLGSGIQTGNASLTGGVLEVGVMTNGGVASSLGATDNTAVRFSMNSGTTLRYVGGTNATTDRSFTINGTADGHGATIESSGASTLSYSGGPALAYGTSNQTRTLTLGGSNADSNTFGKVIANNGTGLTSLVKSGGGTWLLSQTNTYGGATNITGGTLKLGANNALPNTLTSTVTIGTATLDADTRTDTAGTLDVTGNAVINLGTGAALAFADSDAIDWTGGTLNITGTLGATSLRFGTDNTGLTGGANSQLSKISVNGGPAGTHTLDALGYLVPNGDTTPPTLTSIVDNVSGGPVTVGTTVTYTVTFNEDMNAATVSAADFDNDGTASVTIVSTTETSPTSGIFTVLATPTSVGSLKLRIAGPVLADTSANNLVVPLSDDTTLTVQSAYDAWAGGANFADDANNDGVDNGLAFLLGASGPNANAIGLLPKVTQSGGNLVLEFDCLPAAERGAALLNLQHSSDLGFADVWTSALVPGVIENSTVNNVDFVVTDPGAPGGPLRVVATVQVSQAASGKLFGRLNATE